MPARLASLLVTVPARVVFFFFEVAAVSAMRQVGLALPMVVYFHRVGLSGLSANAFIVPILGIACPSGSWPCSLAGPGSHSSQAGCWAFHAPSSPGTPPWSRTGASRRRRLWLGIAFAVALIAFAIARGRAWRIATGAALVVSLALLLWHPFPPEYSSRRIGNDRHRCRPGRQHPRGFSRRQDACWWMAAASRSSAAVAEPQLDIGEDVVAPYLWERSIPLLDVIALSHAHEDHIGGLPPSWTISTPKSCGPAPLPRAIPGAICAPGRRKRGPRIVPMTAPRQFAFGGAEIEILAPLGRLRSRRYLPRTTIRW